MAARPPLTREDIKNVIEFKGCDHIPIAYHFWYGPRGDASQEWQDAAVRIRDNYPYDLSTMGCGQPAPWTAPPDAPNQRWSHKDQPEQQAGGAHGMDSGSRIIEDLAAEVDDFLAVFPDPNYAPYYEGLKKAAGEDTSGKYRLCTSWFCFFERLWSLMGMEATLTNFYTCPDAMHKLIRAICDYHLGTIRNAHAAADLDGFFTSDDIGQQTGTFFSVEIFEEFFQPYYKELIDECHRLGMHYWLHACGNIQAFMPGFVEAGLDVIHPIQKYTMAESDIARDWGGKICFWAGFDVQQILPYGSPEDVRREVRFMIDTYGREDGGLILTAGNGVTPDNAPENCEALFDESLSYGTNYREHLRLSAHG